MPASQTSNTGADKAMPNFTPPPVIGGVDKKPAHKPTLTYEMLPENEKPWFVSAVENEKAKRYAEAIICYHQISELRKSKYAESKRQELIEKVVCDKGLNKVALDRWNTIYFDFYRRDKLTASLPIVVSAFYEYVKQVDTLGVWRELFKAVALITRNGVSSGESDQRLSEILKHCNEKISLLTPKAALKTRQSCGVSTETADDHTAKKQPNRSNTSKTVTAHLTPELRAELERRAGLAQSQQSSNTHKKTNIKTPKKSEGVNTEMPKYEMPKNEKPANVVTQEIRDEFQRRAEVEKQKHLGNGKGLQGPRLFRPVGGVAKAVAVIASSKNLNLTQTYKPNGK